MASYESLADMASNKGVEDPNLSSGKVSSFVYPIHLFIYLVIYLSIYLGSVWINLRPYTG